MHEIEYVKPRSLKAMYGIVGPSKSPVKFIAGGTNVIPDLRAGALSPKLLVDLSGLKELNFVREEKNEIAIGSLATISDIASSLVIREKAPLLFHAARQLGSPLTRNRATIGGNLADASPAADMAPPLLALEAVVHTRRRLGSGRKIPLDQFFLGPNKTRLAKDEIITKITFPKPKEPARGSYIKLGLRNAMTISVSSIAVLLELNGNVCQKARIALGAVAPRPIRAYRIEQKLAGKTINRKNIEESSLLIADEISPISDLRASAEYRMRVTSVLYKRAVQEAANGGRP